MADPREVDGLVERIDRLERSLCVQKEECEERLRLQEEECEEQLRLQEEEYEERLRVQKEEYEEAMVTRMKEMERLTRDITSTCEERLRVQKQEHEGALLAQSDASVKYYWAGRYPLPLEDFPPEIIALIADFVHNFDDLGNMALVSRRVHNGVLLSRQWIVVEEIVAATDGDVALQTEYLHDRTSCARFICTKGLLRSLRALNLSRDEVTSNVCYLARHSACKHGQLEVLTYLHTTYALTADELRRFSGQYHPMTLATPHLPVVKYLHEVMGFEVPGRVLEHAAGDIEWLKYLHREVGFTATDVYNLQDNLVLRAAAGYESCCESSPRARRVRCVRCDDSARERLVYLRDEYGVTEEYARQAIRRHLPWVTWRIQAVFA